MKKRKDAGQSLLLVSGVFVVLAIFCLLAYGSKNRAEAAPNSTVYFNPSSVTPALNSAFNLDAVINPGTNSISAVEVHVTFDHTKLHLNSITPNSVSGAFTDILQAAQIDNNAGTGSIILSTGGSSTGYVTSITTMATFNFTVIASGSSTVGLAGTMAAAQGESGDVITTRTGATVTVASVRTYSLTDFQNIVTHWLQSLSGESNGDYNGDSVINTRDIGVIMHSWQ